MAAGTWEALWLLLLPDSTGSTTMGEVNSKYGPALKEMLRQVSQASRSTSIMQTVDIGIGLTELVGDVPRSEQYPFLHDFVRQLYSLLCIICTEQSITVENDNDVNFRISMYASLQETEKTAILLKKDHRRSESTSLSLYTLASCQRSWRHLRSVDNPAGARLSKAFRLLRERSGFGEAPDILFIPIEESLEAIGESRETKPATRRGHASAHHSVAVGGTFDHLHAGHKLLLTMTALLLEPTNNGGKIGQRTFTIGITGDELLKKKQFAEVLQDWDERRRAVQNFVSAILMLDSSVEELLSSQNKKDPVSGARSVHDSYKSGLRINYVEIFDPFGPTVTDEAISALVVSAETRSGGKAINDRRCEKGWLPLEVFEVDVLSNTTKNLGSIEEMEDGFRDKISSTAIREKIYLCRHRSQPLS